MHSNAFANGSPGNRILKLIYYVRCKVLLFLDTVAACDERPKMSVDVSMTPFKCRAIDKMTSQNTTEAMAYFLWDHCCYRGVLLKHSDDSSSC